MEASISMTKLLFLRPTLTTTLSLPGRTLPLRNPKPHLTFSRTIPPPRLPPTFSTLTTSSHPSRDSSPTLTPPSVHPTTLSLTAVLLGWLGADPKHLKRYAELYRSRGARVVTFIVPPLDLFGVDLGRRVERRIEEFTEEIMRWVVEEEKGGERGLVFHTFSNTGWITYGAILNNLQLRDDIIEKIKGCVVDSGGDPNLNPKVWAAGFCAALLKKRNVVKDSAVSIKEEKLNNNTNGSITPDDRHSFTEWLLLAILEKFFTSVLVFPDVNRRLTTLISVLSKRQPLCPQLYLYSSADKVIPFESVEHFIQLQKASGRMVLSYNFESSPHVDHLRSFPQIYSSEVAKFLEICVPTSVKKT